MLEGTSKLRAIWVGVRPNLACPDISSLMSKENFFLEVLLPEIEVNGGLLVRGQHRASQYGCHLTRR